MFYLCVCLQKSKNSVTVDVFMVKSSVNNNFSKWPVSSRPTESRGDILPLYRDLPPHSDVRTNDITSLLHQLFLFLNPVPTLLWSYPPLNLMFLRTVEV